MTDFILTPAKNQMLDALGALINRVSLHTAFPGDSGANEVEGGDYERVAITWAAASGGQLTASGTPQLEVPELTTVRWLGFWDTEASPNFWAFSPLGGDPKEMQADVAGDRIISEGHGFANGFKVVFVGGTPPGGLTEGTIYFVVNKTDDDFQVAATEGGGAITLTSVGDAKVKVSRIRPEAFDAAGQLTITEKSFHLNL